MSKSIHVKDLYREKHPEEFAEKFPSKKKTKPAEQELSPSERIRLEEELEEPEEPEKPIEPEEPKAPGRSRSARRRGARK